MHKDGCERDKAGNRDLHFDQYCMRILLYLFNPIVTSLRGIQQASELGNKKTGLCWAALGSLSEASSVFDAERLKRSSKNSRRSGDCVNHPRLGDMMHTMTLVDGTLLSAVPKVMEASWRGGRPAKER